MMIKSKHSIKAAFTLIEMLVVMALMALMIGVGVSSFYGMGEGSALTGAVNELQASLVYARQQAILQRSKICIFFTEDSTTESWSYEVWTQTNGIGKTTANGYKIGSTFYVHNSVDLDFESFGTSGSSSYCTFNQLGQSSPGSGSNQKIDIGFDKDDNGSVDSGYYKIQIFSLTGLTKVTTDGN